MERKLIELTYDEARLLDIALQSLTEELQSGLILIIDGKPLAAAPLIRLHSNVLDQLDMKSVNEKESENL